MSSLHVRIPVRTYTGTYVRTYARLYNIIGRAGASPPSRTAATIRRKYTRFFFSDISIFPNLYAMAPCAMDSSA